MRIGILAIQGDVREHRLVLEGLGVEVEDVRLPRDLDDTAGLIIPGGESTTIGMLMKEFGLLEAISAHARDFGGWPIWGTCAGLILLAREVSGLSPARLGLMDITANRNAWGRQVSSFETPLSIPVLGSEPYPAVFIRAPRIERVGSDVSVLAEHDSQAVMAEAGPLMVTAFHPELTGDVRVHRYFVDKAEKFWAHHRSK